MLDVDGYSGHPDAIVVAGRQDDVPRDVLDSDMHIAFISELAGIVDDFPQCAPV